MDSLPASFTADKGLIERFVQFVDTLPAHKRSPFLADLAAARKRALTNGWTAASLKGLEQAERSLEKEISRTIRQKQTLVFERLEQEIRARFGTDEIRQSRALRSDPMVSTAKIILISPKYQLILASQVPSDQ